MARRLRTIGSMLLWFGAVGCRAKNGADTLTNFVAYGAQAQADAIRAHQLPAGIEKQFAFSFL